MLNRRSFLFGSGALVTAAFAQRASAFSRLEHRPLLLAPETAEETLYLYDWGRDDWKWRVCLGPDVWPAPPPPTRRKVLGGNGALERDVAGWALAYGLPASIDEAMDPGAWEQVWDHDFSPQARAYRLFKDLDLGVPWSATGFTGGQVWLEHLGGNPHSCERWVDLKDDLTVSLLQAHLLDRGIPVGVQLAS